MATKVKNKRKSATRASGGKTARMATRPTVKVGATTRKMSGKSTATARRPAGARLTGQQRRDALGLGLLASAVFFAFVFYLGWQGGRLGGAIESALTALAGQAAFLAPVALAVAGAVAILRPALPSPAFRWPAALMLCCGLLLALAAGTLGLGASQPARHTVFAADYYRGHGGASGELLFWVVTKLFGIVGAHVAAVGLTVTGALQMTGTPLLSLIRGVGSLTGRWRGRGVNQAAETDAGRTSRGVRDPAPRAEELLPPEPPGVEPIVRATHVEARALDDVPEPPSEPAEVELVVPDPGPEPIVPIEAQASAGGNGEPNVTESDGVEYRLPNATLLERSVEKPKGEDSAAQEKIAAQLVETLGHFGVEAAVVGTVAGPHVTRFELRLAAGTKMSKVSQLKDDLAYALATTDIRILAPIPGKRAVGVEVPNILRRVVRLGDIYQALPRDWSPVAVWLGKDIAGKAIGTDIAKMPHMLVAGTTGSGKSGCINSLLCSILLGSTPNEVKLVLVDPKQVELNLYEGIPHLLTPVVTSPRMAANVLSNLIREMEQRYTLM
ncbi:MAG: DNA translocase FtsK, partial [Thermoleophilia bacterium]|nr:DNA translocase FtsK [Thermoleophilia bacterium]